MDNEQTTSTVAAITRRTLLKAGGAFAATLAVPEAALARRRRAQARRHQHHHRRLRSHLQRSSYDPLIGKRFNVAGTGSGVRLVDVKDLNPEQAGSEHAFALVFRAPSGSPSLAGGLPEFSHPALGSFALMVVPGAASWAGQHYVAVINRLHA